MDHTSEVHARLSAESLLDTFLERAAEKFGASAKAAKTLGTPSSAGA